MRFLLSIFLILIGNCIYSQSPYKLSKVDYGIFATGIALGGGVYLLENNLKPLSDEEINNLSSNNINTLDKVAIDFFSDKSEKYSDYLTAACIASPVLFGFSKETRKDWKAIGVMYTETVMLTMMLKSLSKPLVKRNRPFVYNPNVDIDLKRDKDARRSFYSGHTSASFSTAVFFSTVFSEYFPESKLKPFVWSGSLIAATSVGYLRVKSGKHFPTDVITGAVIGSAIGYFIPKLHKVESKDLSFLISPGGGSLVWRF